MGLIRSRYGPLWGDSPRYTRPPGTLLGVLLVLLLNRGGGRVTTGALSLEPQGRLAPGSCRTRLWLFPFSAGLSGFGS